MAIISYADAYKKHLEEQKNADKKDIGLTRKYSLESGSDPGADIVLGTLFMNPAKVARGVASATGKETSEGAKKAIGWASMPGAKIEQGFFGAAEGITDFLAGGAAQIAGQKDAAKWIYDHSWSRDAVGADVTDEYVGDAAESKGYRLASDLISGVGNVGFQIAVGTLIGGALAAPVEVGTISKAGAKAIQYAPLFLSASGSGTAENMQKTGNLGWRENVGGLLKGGVEVLTEIASPTGRIANAALFGKSAKGMSRYLVKHAIAKNIIVNFAEEAGEEAASYVGDYYIEKWLKISDDKFSWGDLGYQAVLGGITGALFSSPSDISFVRQARKAGANVYAQGDAAVKNKINEGLIEVKLLKERGLNNDNVKLAEAALAKLTTDENLSQTTKEYYLGLAEQMVLKQNLSDQYNALAKELVAKAKADPATAQSMADAFNALVNEAGGEGKYTAADFTNENSEAARIYVVAQMANDWLSRSDAEIATDEIMRRKAALYQGTAEQKNAIRSMGDGSTVAFRVGANAYAVVTKRAGTDTYSVGFTTPGQVERDGAVYATHKLTAEKVEEMLSKPMTEQQIDAGIVEILAKKAQAEVEKEQKAEKKQAKAETKKKPAAKTEAKTEEATKKKAETESKGKKKTPVQAKKAGEEASLSPAIAETEQTAKTEAKEKVAPEDLSTVEKRLTSAFGIDGSEFTKEEWTKARECVPNIDGLTRREQARVLTLVRTAQANGINEDYMKGLARLSSVYGFGVVFEDIDVAGFYSRKNGMVVINPKNLDETYGHEIEHSFDQIVKEDKAEFRTDLSEKVKRIVGASVFDRAKAQYKADYEKLRARDGSVAELSDAELEAEATANVVGKYLSNMTLLKKIAATDFSLGRGLLAAIRRMKDKWTSAKAFAKENDSTAFVEYRKMTRIEKMIVEELREKKYAALPDSIEATPDEKRTPPTDREIVSTWERVVQEAQEEEAPPLTQEPEPLSTVTEEMAFSEEEHTEEPISAVDAHDESAEQTERSEEAKKKRPARETGESSSVAPGKPGVTKTTSKISDFGEKIGGARKDEWIARGLNLSDLDNMNEAEKAKYCKKDFIWRRPDYVKLVEGGQDRVVLFAKNELRKSLASSITYRPGMSEEAREAYRNLYVSTVSEIRNKVNACQTREDFARILEWATEKGFIRTDESGRLRFGDSAFSNPALGADKRAEFNLAMQSIYGQKTGDFINTILMIVKKWDSLATKADRAGFAVDASKKVPRGFEIWKAKDGTFEIIKGHFIIKRGISTYDDALREIQNAMHQKKMKTRFVPAQLQEVHRTGYNYRVGKNVEGQDYLDTFGFRGGEFGNWMTEKDRQVSLDYGYDALCDLADALGIDYRSISLQGKLAIAFGARGQGLSGAAAHYEPERTVINLTKMHGAGSLAHEWMHALDDYLAIDGRSSAIESGQAKNTEIRAAFEKLSNAMKYREATPAEVDARKQHVRERYERILDTYLRENFGWVRIMEEGRTVQADRYKKVPTADDLARYNALKERLLRGDKTAIEEISQLRKEIFGHVISAEHRNNIGFATLGLSDSGTTVRVPRGQETDFYKDAQLLDTVYAKDGGYWSSREEMAARAFAVYVYDKIKDENFRDDYLVGHAQSAAAILDENGKIAYGYPRGEDRVRINAAFDNLFDTIKKEQILAAQKQSERPDLVSYSPAKTRIITQTGNKIIAFSENVNQYNEEEEKSILRDSKNSVAKSYEDVKSFFRESISDNYQKRQFVGKLKQSVSKIILEKTGINTYNKGVVLTSDDIRHIVNNHGSEIKEASRGQTAINEDNFLLIVETLFSPDDVFLSVDEKSGTKSILFEKSIDGEITAVTLVSEKKKALSLKSAWINKKTEQHISPPSDDQAPNLTPKSELSMNTVPANSISQNVSNVNPSGEKSSLSPSPVTRETDIRYSPMSASERVVLRARKPKESIVQKFKNGEINRTEFRKAIDKMIESAKILTVNAQQAVENQLIRGGMSKRQAGAYTQFARSARSHSFNAVSISLADMNGDVRARGLFPILEPFLATKGEVCEGYDEKTGEKVTFVAEGGELAGQRFKDFSTYYSTLNAIERAAVGKNPYSSVSVAQMKADVAEFERKNPDFKAAADELVQFNSVMLDIRVQSGLLSQKLADELRKRYPHYIPMKPMESNGVGKGAAQGSNNLEVNRGLRTATESDHRTFDPFSNYIAQIESTIKAAKLNILLGEIYATADNDNVVKGTESQKRAKELRQMERDYLADPDSAPDPAELFRKFKDEHDKVKNEITFYKDGSLVTMGVTDRIYTGVSDLAGLRSTESNFWIVQASKKINDTFKKLVTNWNPFFGIKNIARDLQDGSLQTQFGLFEYLNEYRKNAEMMLSGKYNDMWTEFLANGGLESSLFSDEFGQYAKRGKSSLEKAEGVAGAFQHIKNFNTLTEALPRFTEYCLTRKHGGTVQTALLNAADVTVNFGRSGTLVRVLNSTVSPFLNPAVQGMDRVIRLFTENGIKNNKALASLLIKAVLLAIIPMVLSNAMYGDDDEYKDMQDRIKENNYLFKIGDTWLKLPRGRVVSTISGLYNRSYKELMGEDVDWKDYGKNVLDQITPAQNVARHIASPFVDVANNKTWYGTAIESMSLQNYAVKDRYDENTSRISVWIGQLTSHFGLSPKKVNYLLDQYTGVIGDILLPTTTPAGTKGVVSYNFTVDPNTSSNLSSRFYDLYDKTMYKANGGDAEAYYLKKRLDETKSAASELFKEIKAINADSSLSNKEKVKQAGAVRAMVNQLYKTALQDAKGYAENVKDAIAIEKNYSVEQITQQNAKQYGLTKSDLGKYAVMLGGQVVKLYGSEGEATEYKNDTSKKTVYAEANRLTYGSEYALKEYNANVYDKASTLNELGVSWDEYYNYYMTVRYYSGADKKKKILAYLNGSGLSKSQIALLMYYSGYSAYADEAKKAIKASSLSAERKKELLMTFAD